MKIKYNGADYDLNIWSGARFGQFATKNNLPLGNEAEEIIASELYREAQRAFAQQIVESRGVDVKRAKSTYVCKAGQGWQRRDIVEYNEIAATSNDRDAIREHIAKVEARNVKTATRMREAFGALSKL